MATYDLRRGSIRASISVLGWAAVIGISELRALYTWRTWVFGWLVRVLAQVTFFALLGVLIGQPERVQFLVIGNAVMISALEATAVLTSTSLERASGTLPLLVAAPRSHITVFMGRGVHWLGTGLVSSVTSLGVSALVFNIDLPWPAALWLPVLILLSAVSTYALATFVAAFAMWAPGLSAIVMNMTYMTIMVASGVNVPVSFWPAWVGAIAHILPLTHGLAAVRGLFSGLPGWWVVGQALREALVGVGWCITAVLSYRYLATKARRSGAIEFDA